MPLKFALALFAISDLSMALRLGFENPRNAVRAEWLRLAPMIVAGTALGVTLLVNLPRQAGMLLLGVFVVAYAVYALMRHEHLKPVSAAWAWLAGFAGGITSTLFGAGGPPYAIYLSQRGLTKEQFRATMGFATMTSISLRVLAFLATGLLLDPEVWLAALAAVPAALAGIFIATRAFVKIPREVLMRVVSLLLLASGGSLVWHALG